MGAVTGRRSAPVAALRDLLLGRVRDHDRRLCRYDDETWEQHRRLLTATFHLAVGRRFRPGQDAAPLIRFVASVRERYGPTGYQVDPVTAERLLRAALGEVRPPPLDRQAVTAVTLLLAGLVEDEGLSPAEVDDLLAEAERLLRLSEEADEAVADRCAEEADEEPESGVARGCGRAGPGLAPGAEHQESADERDGR